MPDPLMAYIAVTFHPVESGGRHTIPDLTGGQYRPHLVVPNAPEQTYLGVRFIECKSLYVHGIEMEAWVDLPYDGVDYSALKPGARFLIREGRKTVGEGHVIAR